MALVELFTWLTTVVVAVSGGGGAVGGPDIAQAQTEAVTAGTVWKVLVDVGDPVEPGDAVVTILADGSEVSVESQDEGRVAEILVNEGQAVHDGDPLVRIE
jgi:acetyl-CoA carboxylase biotin carboxyl carrier protein